MAFNTLQGLRLALNVRLGLTNDSDNRFGTTAERNIAIQDSIARLWPMCARLVKTSLVPAPTNVTYLTTDVRDIVTIEVMRPNQTITGPTGKYTHYRAWVDEASDPPNTTLTLFSPLPDGTQLLIIGYKPYVVPAADGSAADIPPLMEPVVLAGAMAYIYLRRLNQFVDFERHQNADRSTQLTPEQVLAMYQTAAREYAEGKVLWQRGMSEGKVATFR